MAEELNRARAEESEAKLARTRVVVNQLLAEGTMLSATAIARQARVSKSFVSKHFGSEIAESRATAAATGASAPPSDLRGASPAMQRMQRELSALRTFWIQLFDKQRDENASLHTETRREVAQRIQWIRRELADLQTDSRRLREEIGDLGGLRQHLYSMSDARTMLGGLDIDLLIANGDLVAHEFNGQKWIKAGSLESFFVSLPEARPQRAHENGSETPPDQSDDET